MKVTEKQFKAMASAILESLKKHNIITFKEKEETVLQRAIGLVRADFEREAMLDIEVNQMMDALEKQNPGEFQRYKMFPMLKKRLAKEKGIIL